MSVSTVSLLIQDQLRKTVSLPFLDYLFGFITWSMGGCI
jgi:hypothetical protein